MKILNKLTYDYLKLNKKKCIATLVSIILITVLLFSVGIFVSTIRKTALDAVIAEDGTKHVLFSEQDYSNYSILNSDENIKSIEITCLIDIINDELSIESIDDSLWDGISISKGRIPNNTNEIVISSAYASTYNLDVSSFVGEKEVVGIYNNSTLKNDLYTAFTKEVDYNNRTVSFYVTYKSIFNIYDKIYNTADNLRLSYSIVMGNKSYAYTWVNSSYLALLGQFSDNDLKLGVYALIFFVLFITSLFCILIVRNSFTINLVERKKQFATLRSIGASKAQIFKMVIIEAFMLSIIAIPIGIILSIIFSNLIILVFNNILENIIDPLSIYYYPSLIIISLLFIIFTIFTSAFVPALKASKISPISGIKPVYNLKKSREKYPLINKLFGPLGVLAYKNTKRNKNKFNSSIISMSISIILFITFSFLINNIVIASEDVLLEDFDISINILDDSVLYNEILSIPEIDEVITYKSAYLYYDNGKFPEEDMDSLLLVGVDNNYYQEHYDNGIYVINAPDDIREFQLYDNEYNYVYTINEFRESNDMLEFIHINSPVMVVDFDTYDKILTNYSYDYHWAREYSIGINTDKPEVFDKYMEEVINDFTEVTINYINYAYYNYEARQILLAIKFVCYTIIGAIAILSISAMFNSLNTNIITREKEFAMLRSMGLSKKDLNKLLIYEGIFLGIKTLIISLIISIILIFGMGKLIKLLNISSLKNLIFPTKYVIIAIVILIALIFLVIMYSKNKIKNNNIVDAIKNENI